MDIRIRKARNDDVDALIALSRRTISTSYPSFLGAEAVESYITSGAVDQYVQENIERCLALVRNGRVVGYSVTKDNLIDLLMVDVDSHRSGLGTALLHHVENILFQTHEALVLETFAGNERAITFYRKHGWVEARRFADELSGAEKIEFQKSRGQ